MKKVPFYPLCIALFGLLSVFAANTGEASAAELVSPAAIVLLATMLLFGAVRLAMRDVHRAALVVAAAVFFFLSYRLWVNVLWSIWPVQSLRLIYFRTVLVFQGLLLIGIAYAALRRLKSPRSLTSRLNALSLVLLACPVLVVASREGLFERSSAAAASPDVRERQLPAVLNPSVDRPDIYFIVLDAHGRQDILREQYDYDNAPFIQHLRDKGFYVAQQSCSNYMWTEVSVPSALNMRYLNDLPGQDQQEKQRLSVELFSNNALTAELKTVGYHTVAFEAIASWLCLKNSNIYYSISDHVGFTAFQQLILDTSALSQFGGDAIRAHFALDQFHLKREMMLYKLAKLPQVAARPGPKFVFLHIMSPHTPFVFAADGSDPVKRGYGSMFDGINDDITSEQYHHWYREQATFTDNQVGIMIDRVLAASRKPPIIVLIGDHGPRAGMIAEPDASSLRECLSNLTAVYLPGKNHRGLYPRITPVNLFRIVLNDYFDAKLPMLEDKSYYSYPDMFDLRDVTDVTESPVASVPIDGH